MSKASDLTKRELFAAMAMEALCGWNNGNSSEEKAAHAVKCADALIKALGEEDDRQKAGE
jgi:hypothetical protein